MRSRPKGIVGVFKETFHSWSEDKAPRLAAALSYYTIFSIAPLLVLVIAITGFVVGNNAAIRDQILGQVQNLVGQQGASMVSTLITNTSRPRDGILATLIGVITLIFGATGVFNQLKDALNTIWEVAPKQGLGVSGMVKERLSGFVMILGLGFLLLVSLVISTALSVLNTYFTNLLGSTGPAPMLINYGIQILVITIIFGAMFKELPDVKLGWADVWVGALFTTMLFLVGQYLISLYLSKASPASAYGAAGSLVVVLLWLYYSAQILLLGAEFTKAYTLARGHQVAPTEAARRLMPEERIHQGIARPVDEERVRPVPEGARRGGVVAAAPAAAPIPVSGEEPAAVEERPGAEERPAVDGKGAAEVYSTPERRSEQEKE